MKHKETSFFTKLAIFGVAVFAAVTVVQLQFKYNELKEQRDELKAEVMQLEDKKDELKNEADAEVDSEYIAEVAKEKLNLRLPEEIIFYNDLYN